MDIIAFGGTFFGQLLVALVLGMLIGTERTLAHKTAGLRTYGLVSMGSCLFIVVVLALKETLGISSADLTRVIAGLITGVGFLGAGVIILRDQTLVGLTTAAGLWVASGIGVAVGFQLYIIAFYTTLLTLLTFTVFWFLEKEVTHIGPQTGDTK
ncbi:MgtC/SapB family protein [Candidatus Campbellbacteria bacterium]|nr:MAG: MgtC/SapB family protein [Candidatus Campbellbacteria bacterium]